MKRFAILHKLFPGKQSLRGFIIGERGVGDVPSSLLHVRDEISGATDPDAIAFALAGLDLQIALTAKRSPFKNDDRGVLKTHRARQRTLVLRTSNSLSGGDGAGRSRHSQV